MRLLLRRSKPELRSALQNCITIGGRLRPVGHGRSSRRFSLSTSPIIPRCQSSLRVAVSTPSTVIADRQGFELSPIIADDRTHKVQLDVVQWRTVTQKSLYLCDENGFPLTRTNNKFHTGDVQFSAYLRSSYVSLLHEEGTLDLVEMNPPLQTACDEAVSRLRAIPSSEPPKMLNRS